MIQVIQQNLICFIKNYMKGYNKLENRDILKNYIDQYGRVDIANIIDKYSNYVYTIVKNLKNIQILDEDIEEIVSDTFFAIWKNFSNLSENVEVKSYLAGTCKNVLKNKYRKVFVYAPISNYEKNSADFTYIDKVLEEKDEYNEIKTAIKNLSKDEYDVFIMFYYDDISIKNIDQSLNFSEGKVKVMLHRIRKKIKKILIEGGNIYEE